MGNVKIFGFEKYKAFVLKWIESLSGGGRGQLQRLAGHLSVHPTLMSQVLRGDKDFTAEQACKVAEFLGLNERESDYFLALVERDRAGNSALKAYWQRRIDSLHNESLEVSSRLLPAHKLTRNQQTEFYSTWEYSAVRLATSIGTLKTIDKLSRRLGLSTRRCNEILEFLIESNLCVEKAGSYQMGPLRTHIRAESSLAGRHHLNWRIKGIESHSNLQKDELVFSAPLSISRADQPKVKEIMLEAIEAISNLVEKSSPEELSCLNIDWFNVRSLR
jgi:uncharacterized protein (TIGR02147 family)